MKRVQFKNGYKTKMTDEVAKIYEGKKKVKILSDVKEEKRGQAPKKDVKK